MPMVTPPALVGPGLIARRRREADGGVVDDRYPTAVARPASLGLRRVYWSPRRWFSLDPPMDQLQHATRSDRPKRHGQPGLAARGPAPRRTPPPGRPRTPVRPWSPSCPTSADAITRPRRSPQQFEEHPCSSRAYLGCQFGCQDSSRAAPPQRNGPLTCSFTVGMTGFEPATP